ncbi:hypothetical protein [Thalassococcus sp. S3]|uniref:hypothetical protein n=1 Tax=Thalassococcus sp. S3 TaxID=2017482 RepID=UPI00102444E5|nr:hypothetical protein [Thalassococcus sp. S3]QBF33272.1 hypothetical protein CFI11_18880 [Thalassococcus sp. S3]
MSDQMIAVLVFGALCAGALVMFLLERRAVAKRRAEGREVDISDILFFGSEAVTGKNPAPEKKK